MPTKIPLSLVYIVYSVKEEATKVSPEGNMWLRHCRLEPSGHGTLQRTIKPWHFSGFQGCALQPRCSLFVCTRVSASALIKRCAAGSGQVGFQASQKGFSLAPLQAALSVFILKMCFQNTISWNLLAAARYEIPSCKSKEKVSCQAEVYNKRVTSDAWPGGGEWASHKDPPWEKFSLSLCLEIHV